MESLARIVERYIAAEMLERLGSFSMDGATPRSISLPSSLATKASSSRRPHYSAWYPAERARRGPLGARAL
ncbi:hypothetical protein PC128_g4266 [Phytophthora cactorum]|nr:hypothetical protein PC120_g3552 [Phytophthora cactorum]KAG3200887.1 hypothetical protein PC128_g4266 [Phytophthora cactorum]